MNQPGGHVVLFARWLGAGNTRAWRYEPDPYSKVIAGERDLASLAASGFKPMRYWLIRDYNRVRKCASARRRAARG